MNGAAASALASMGWYPNMARAAEGEKNFFSFCGWSMGNHYRL